MQQTAVINVVGLSRSHIGVHTPNMQAFESHGELRALQPVLPAVTCSVQSSMLTGQLPAEHGIVGNGWYNREQSEVELWKQSNRLVQGDKVWDVARHRDASFTCANMFWWYNMYSSVDYSVTPRPQYKADGRKIPDVYTHPATLRDELQSELGRFPLFNFWGPMSSIVSSQWIAEASKRVHERYNPTLMLVYLPHLDYPLQKVGPSDQSIPNELRAIDEVVGDLMNFFDSRGVRVIILSEYGIEPVDETVHINRKLREAGLLRVRDEDGELLDAGASSAFAVADHQIAHIYIQNETDVNRVREVCESMAGVDRVLDADGKREFALDHARSGNLVLIAQPSRWFSYYYWLDDAYAPDFARTVDIHRKPGYDPVELFLDPRLTFPKLAVGSRLLKRKLGMRALLDVIPLDASLVRGSHGRVDASSENKPVVMVQDRATLNEVPEEPSCCAIAHLIQSHIFGGM